MGKALVIVESPAKAKTINKILGSDFKVKSSVGHIKDLPVKVLGVDIENDFTPEYVTIRGKGKIISELKAEAKGCDTIYLAADPDREGEAICWHLANELKRSNANIYRVLFFEITKSAVLEAFNHAGKIDINKVNSQQARRVLDRLVGYKVSPLLWKKVSKGLSAGRVQSVALRLICERQAAIDAFIPEDYWNILANLSASVPPAFLARLVAYEGKKLVFGIEQPKPNEMKIGTEEVAANITKELAAAPYSVTDVEKKKRARNPPFPFITSTLQQEASQKIGYGASRTMRVAQDLYEGITLGSQGPVGLITYMRTDSTRDRKSVV